MLKDFTKGNYKHIAYCTGPAQLASLLSAIKILKINRNELLLLLYPGVANDKIKNNMLLLTNALNIKSVELKIENVQSKNSIIQSINIVLYILFKNDIVFWYCRGVINPISVYNIILKLRPAKICEYYDGYRTPIVLKLQNKASEIYQRKGTILSNCKALSKSIFPESIFMPINEKVLSYLDVKSAEQVVKVPQEYYFDAMREVGSLLNCYNSFYRNLLGKVDYIINTGMFCERYRDIAIESEIKLYSDIIKEILNVNHQAIILIKPHPRTSQLKFDYLKKITEANQVFITDDQQLLEFLMLEYGKNATVIGPPSTSLLNVIWCSLGVSISLGYELLCSYLGNGYSKIQNIAEDHFYMRYSGISQVESMLQLKNKLINKN